jgi:hypothetical protein
VLNTSFKKLYTITYIFYRCQFREAMQISGITPHHLPHLQLIRQQYQNILNFIQIRCRQMLFKVAANLCKIYCQFLSELPTILWPDSDDSYITITVRHHQVGEQFFARPDPARRATKESDRSHASNGKHCRSKAILYIIIVRRQKRIRHLHLQFVRRHRACHVSCMRG